MRSLYPVKTPAVSVDYSLPLVSRQEAVTILASAGINVDSINELHDNLEDKYSPRYPVHWAAYRRNIPVLNALISLNADLNTMEKSSKSFPAKTALHFATLNRKFPWSKTCKWSRNRFINDMKILSMLLDANANMNQPDGQGTTVLGQAVCGLKCPVIKLLVEKGADTNQLSRMYGLGKTKLTMLGYLATLSSIEGVMQQKSERIIAAAKLLISHGANINLPIDGSGHGETPLICAIKTKCFRCSFQPVDPEVMALQSCAEQFIKLLLENGADINLADSSGMTPLIQAISDDNIKAVQLLLTYHKLDVNKSDSKGHTPLMHATITTGSISHCTVSLSDFAYQEIYRNSYKPEIVDLLCQRRICWPNHPPTNIALIVTAQNLVVKMYFLEKLY